MKIAVLADIHANWVALQTVLDHLEGWKPDLTIVPGDIVNRGPRPRQCWQLIQEKLASRVNWLAIRGNHEDYIISHSKNNYSLRERDFHALSLWTHNQLRDAIPALDELSDTLSLPDAPGGEIRVRHASMHHNRDGLYPEDSDQTLLKKIAPSPAVFITGHTHRPLIRSLGASLVVNAGSVGLPFDRNTAAAYAQLTWSASGWQAEIIRLDYDLSAALREFELSGMLAEAGPLAYLVMVELLSAHSLLYSWAVRFREAILAGHLTTAQAVRQYLDDCQPDIENPAARRLLTELLASGLAQGGFTDGVC
jgi:predicted phosphodiesterase